MLRVNHIDSEQLSVEQAEKPNSRDAAISIVSPVAELRRCRAGEIRRLRAKPDKKFVDGQAAIPSW